MILQDLFQIIPKCTLPAEILFWEARELKTVKYPKADFILGHPVVTEEMIPTTKIATSSPSQSSLNTSNSNCTVNGTKKFLSSVRNLLDVSSKVIVKLVYKIFPWNRRARRRVLGDGEDDELWSTDLNTFKSWSFKHKQQPGLSRSGCSQWEEVKLGSDWSELIFHTYVPMYL